MKKMEFKGLDYSFECIIDKRNRRLKVFKHHCDSHLALTEKLIEVAKDHELSKIWLRAEAHDWMQYLESGFRLEAIDPHFFRGKPAFHLAYFLETERTYSAHWEGELAILRGALNKAASKTNNPSVTNFQDQEATINDIPQMVKLFKKVFTSYPTPITEPDYLKECMEDNTHFHLIFKDAELIACASAEIDWDNLNAEMTDCATHPDWNGQGLMTLILQKLEYEMHQQGLYSLYTIARSKSPGINNVFKKLGYAYGGQFINNCDICGQFEDMNLWSKKIETEQ